jgi:hypothetical protein
MLALQIQRSFRQNMSAAIGAFKLLAETIDPDELNKVSFDLRRCRMSRRLIFKADINPFYLDWLQPVR